MHPETADPDLPAPLVDWPIDRLRALDPDLHSPAPDPQSPVPVPPVPTPPSPVPVPQSPSPSPLADLVSALDPVAFSRSLGIEPDGWQADVLRWTGRRLILNCARQTGKSTTAATLALHRAIYYPDSLILLVSSLRQSAELFRKVAGLLNRPAERPALVEDNRLSCTLANRSRDQPPSSEATIRGFSGAALIIEDEASRVSDDLYRGPPHAGHVRWPPDPDVHALRQARPLLGRLEWRGRGLRVGAGARPRPPARASAPLFSTRSAPASAPGGTRRSMNASSSTPPPPRSPGRWSAPPNRRPSRHGTSESSIFNSSSIFQSATGAT